MCTAAKLRPHRQDSWRAGTFDKRGADVNPYAYVER